MSVMPMDLVEPMTRIRKDQNETSGNNRDANGYPVVKAPSCARILTVTEFTDLPIFSREQRSYRGCGISFSFDKRR